jgi:hypothetical protein
MPNWILGSHSANNKARPTNDDFRQGWRDAAALPIWPQ